MGLLSTLFATRGTIMLTAGDEFGRTQGGNNNAYAQDNAITWLDWIGRDLHVEAHACACMAARAASPHLTATRFLGEGDVRWTRPDGEEMTEADWHDPNGNALAMLYREGPAILINRGRDDICFRLAGEMVEVPARSVVLHG